MTKQIPLTQGLFATVDDEDFARVNKFKWFASKGCRTFYARRNSGKGKDRKTISLHSFIMGSMPEVEIDHADRNGLNCCRNNLRVATRSQNGGNRTTPITNTSGYKGVSKRNKKWRVRIVINGKAIEKQGFASAEIAARKYDELAIKHFGKFAATNFQS